MGHHVTLVAPQYGPGDASNPNLIRIPSRAVPFDPEDRMMKGRELFRQARRLDPRAFDIIHIHTPFIAHYTGIKLAREFGIPKVETYHTFFEEYLYNYVPFLPKGWLRYLARKFSKDQCNDVDALVVPSSAMLETLRNYGVTSPAEIVPTGIELSQFAAGDGKSFRRRHGIAADRPTMLYVGRVALEKNIDFLLRVLSEVRRDVPNVLLLIAGEGPATEWLKRLAAELNLQENIKFVGYLSRDQDLQDCYCAGDVFVFASRTETQGLVLLEAMALGAPVVSTAVMGTKDILHSQTGAFVAEESVGDFADKVVLLLRDSELRSRLGIQAAAYARRWSAEALAAKMIQFYERVLAEQNREVTANKYRRIA
jgi:1,2-diacylglycerol 3-alpha-glucosyltransferase